MFSSLLEVNQTLRALEAYLRLPNRPQPLLAKIVIWLPNGMEDDGLMKRAGWLEHPSLMHEFARRLEKTVTIASEQGVRIVTEIMDESQVGVTRRLWDKWGMP